MDGLLVLGICCFFVVFLAISIIEFVKLSLKISILLFVILLIFKLLQSALKLAQLVLLNFHLGIHKSLNFH